MAISALERAEKALFCLLVFGDRLLNQKNLCPHLSHQSNRVGNGRRVLQESIQVALKGHPESPIPTTRELLANFSFICKQPHRQMIKRSGI